MTTSAPILVLLCGLPASGKTTLAKCLEASSSTSTRVYERISFDDLYAEAAGETGVQPIEFDPRRWKTCQQEMAQRVKSRMVQQWAAPGDSEDAQQAHRQLVLLVDDNFHYRSQRKRFSQLAAEQNCGIALLYVNVPTEICRERNATRNRQLQGDMQIPDEVFQRMADAFEPPGSRQNSWDRIMKELGSEDVSSISKGENAGLHEVMDVLVEEAGHALEARRQQQAEARRRLAQQDQDHKKTCSNVLHLVDLQIRKWISSQLRSESDLPPNTSKAVFATRLNNGRKMFLSEMKRPQSMARLSCIFDNEIGTPAEGKAAIDRVVVSLVRRFQEQQFCDVDGD